MNVLGHDIAVCSWSLLPKDATDLVAQVRRLGLAHVQLAVRSFLDLEDAQRSAEIKILRRSGLTITAGMIDYAGEDYSSILSARLTCGVVPDAQWSERRESTLRAGRLLADLEVDKLTCHVGFIPISSEPGYATLVERVRELASSLESLGVHFGLETGQETASELLQFLNDVRPRSVFANFDPANMILYGNGDPIASVETLGRHIGHVHAKDAIWSSRPGLAWGEEVPFGQGKVDVKAFLNALWDIHYNGPIAIEREAGQRRFEDVETAIQALAGVE